MLRLAGAETAAMHLCGDFVVIGDERPCGHTAARTSRLSGRGVWDVPLVLAAPASVLRLPVTEGGALGLRWRLSIKRN
jgi:hypothetical protein